MAESPNFDPTQQTTRRNDLAQFVGRKVGGRYEVRSIIGAGGMGEVYRAWDPVLRRDVALKRLLPGTRSDDENKKRLLHEARLAVPVDHDAVVAIYDVVEEISDSFIVQEFIDGQGLRKWMTTPFNLEWFLRFAQHSVGALVAAASKGVVHCDIKPENILITESGKPKILDFGIARRAIRIDATTENLTSLSTEAQLYIRGTPGYIAPEVIQEKHPDARADIFSLGVVFYEVLTGVNPFRRPTPGGTLLSTVNHHPRMPSEINRKLPPALDPIVERMLRKEPADRYSSPSELLVAIQELSHEIMGGRDSSPRDAELRAGMDGAQLRGTTRTWVAIGGAAMLSISIIGIASLIREKRAPIPASAPADRHLVVERFQNLTDEPKWDYFCIGLSQALSVRLAGLRGVLVVDPAPAKFGAANNAKVQYALGGGIQRAGDSLRVTYKFVDRGTSVTLGGAQIRGSVQELFELQDSVVEEVAKALATRFEDKSAASHARLSSSDPRAYDFYLQARGYLSGAPDHRNVSDAINLLERAIKLDSKFVPAMASLGEAYWRMYRLTRDSSWIDKAKDMIGTALALGPDYAEPHVANGIILEGTGDAERSENEFRRALQLEPGSYAAYQGLGRLEESAENLEAAENAFARAIEAHPNDWAAHNDLGAFYFRHGRYTDAAESFRRAVALSPDNYRGYSNLGGMYQLLGKPEEAIGAYTRSLEIKPNAAAFSNRAVLFIQQGRLAEAEQDYRGAIGVDSLDYRIWGNLAAALQRIPGREAGSDSATRRAIGIAERQFKINPKDPVLLVNLGQYYAATDQPKLARDRVERALAIAPKQTDVLLSAAAVHASLEDRSAALRLLGILVESGYSVALLAKNPEFVPLLEDPSIKALTAERVPPEERPGS